MKRQNRKWTDEDSGRLRELAAKGVSPIRIGIILKRSTNTVKLKARELGIRFPRVPPFSIDRLLDQARSG